MQTKELTGSLWLSKETILASGETRDIDSSDVWGVECSCRGLNPNCLKCNGWGRIQNEEVTPAAVMREIKSFAYHSDLKWSKSGKSFVVEPQMTDLMPTGITKTFPDSNSVTTYYCVMCEEYVKPVQLFRHSHHPVKVLSRRVSS